MVDWLPLFLKLLFLGGGGSAKAMRKETNPGVKWPWADVARCTIGMSKDGLHGAHTHSLALKTDVSSRLSPIWEHNHQRMYLCVCLCVF